MNEENLSKPVVKLEDVSFGYKKDKKVLDAVSIEVNKMERAALIGPNGAGKSTLINLLNGILFPDEGRVLINSVDVSKKNIKEIRSKVGIVFQNPDDQLFCSTVYEDIAFGPLNQGFSPEEIDVRVSKALNSVGMQGFEERSSFDLSFGERKLVSIATVAAMEPDIIALDEPVSNLDHLHRRKIIEWIKRMNDKTIILSTHDLDMAAETCNKVFIINRGNINAKGSPAELFNDEALLKANNLELPLSQQNINYL